MYNFSKGSNRRNDLKIMFKFKWLREEFDG